MEAKLVHSGIKGMKWGVRRYQNSDGSLTPEGRKRYGSGPSRKGFFTKKTSKTSSAAKSKSSTQKSYKTMSDEELSRTVKRLQLEQKYRELNPQKKSLGKRFISSVANDVIIPAAKSAGRAYVEKEIKRALGVKDNDKDKDKKK